MYQQKTKPYDHQQAYIDKHLEDEAFAFWWEMGVAKTKPVIDTIGQLFESGKINGALVLAPKSICPNWTADEIPDHLGTDPDRVHVLLWDTSKANGKRYQEWLAEFLATPPEKLAILVMSYNAVMTHRKKGAKRGLLKGYEAAKKLLTTRRCMMVLDESARIKGPDTKRAKRVIAAGPYSKYRRIMTGTPVTQSPFDVYSQLKFLDPEVWKRMGCGTFAAFRTMFGVWVEHERKDNGQRFKQLVDYQNLATLNKVVDSMGERLLKDDVLDLPPKLYEKRTFSMAPEQRKLYDELKREFLVMLDDGDMVTAALAITRMLRLQQITSGYCPTDDGDMIAIEPNPRLACLMDTIEDIPHQCIIFGKFQKDIDLIEAALLKADKTCVVYDGRVSQATREIRRSMFKTNQAQFFIANPAAAGEGLTLHMAKTVIFYNTTYKMGERLQAEDRAHRAGMDDRPVHYIDIVAAGSIDANILRSLRTKKSLADQITGDKAREWLA